MSLKIALQIENDKFMISLNIISSEIKNDKTSTVFSIVIFKFSVSQ